MAINYKDAGVDIATGDELVGWLQSDHRPQPHSDKVLAGIGGFASVFEFNFPEYQQPCLVSATDGVGTKLLLAIEFDDYSGIGQDLVAMCANDLVCTGAQPLFFLDYYATGKLDLRQIKPFLAGLKQACREVGAALVGGETAEMPGMYKIGDFDCAGFAVGVVDKPQILGAAKVRAGDVLIGLASSGFHANGYSLVRKLFAADAKDFKSQLLAPTKLYVQPLLAGQKKLPGLHALAHITGGGIQNIPRVIPPQLSLKFETWEWPDIFREAQRRSQLTDSEMLDTFNCGIGMVAVVAKEAVDHWCHYLREASLGPQIIGEVRQ